MMWAERDENVFHQVVVELHQLGSRAIRQAGLDKADTRFLLALHREASSQAALSTKLSIDPGDLSRRTKRLQKGGYISGEPRGTAIRGQRLHLTSKGKDTIFDALACYRSLISEHLSALSLHEKERLAVLGRGLVDLPNRRANEPLIREGEVGDGGLLISFAARTMRSGFFGHNLPSAEVTAADAFLRYSKANDRIFLVSEHDGLMRGGLIATGLQKSQAARIDLLVTEFAYVGRGLGHSLLNRALERLKSDGFRHFVAEAPRDVNGESFFERAGWTLTRSLGEGCSLEEWTSS